MGATVITTNAAIERWKFLGVLAVQSKKIMLISIKF